jgi:thioredoxin 2
MMAPAFEAAARELEPEIRLLKFNADNDPELAGALGVRAIPTLLVFRGGREIARTAGAMSRPALVDWTRRTLKVAA